MSFISSEEINKPDNPEVLFELENLTSFNTGLYATALGILLSPVYYFGGASLHKNNLLVNLKRRFRLSKVFDQVVGNVFKSDNDARRDLIGRNVPRYMTTVTQGQNLFYFLRVCVCAFLVNKIEELVNDVEFAKVSTALLEWTEEGEENNAQNKSLITVDEKRLMVYDRRGLHICYSHKFIEKLHGASVKGLR